VKLKVLRVFKVKNIPDHILNVTCRMPDLHQGMNGEAIWELTNWCRDYGTIESSLPNSYLAHGLRDDCRIIAKSHGYRLRFDMRARDWNSPDVQRALFWRQYYLSCDMQRF
jgi:hypothetical protein